MRECLLCEKELRCATPDEDWSTRPPCGGGEVHFIFAYGSTKFDNNIESTVFKGYICDDCAEQYVDKMEESNLCEHDVPD